MALTDDQRAMLQLLLEGGQSYADIGSLLGVDAAEVRSRSRAALTDMGGADPDAKVGLTDYLLGQADPIGRADAARQLQNDPDSAALAGKLEAQLRLLAPKARLPELPGSASVPPSSAQVAQAGGAALGSPTEPGGVGAAAARSGAAARKVLDSAGRGVSGLGSRDRRLPVIIAGAGLVVLVAVLLITGVIGGGGGDNSSSSDSTTTNAANTELPVVQLEGVNGSKASGVAAFANAKDQVFMRINLAGLKPTGNNETYIVWLSTSQQNLAFPIARDKVQSDGNLTGDAPLNSQLLGLIGPQGFTQVTVTLASDSQTAAALKAAADKKTFPALIGDKVLQGDIPSNAAASAGTGTGATSTPATTTPAQ